MRERQQLKEELKFIGFKGYDSDWKELKELLEHEGKQNLSQCMRGMIDRKIKTLKRKA